MKKTISKLKKNRSGQAAVEMILVLPFLILILFSIIDLGLLAVKDSEIKHDAYEAATYASIKVEPATGQMNTLISKIQTYVDNEYSDPVLKKGKLCSDVKVKSVAVSSDSVRVTLSYTTNYITALPGVITRSNQVTLTEDASVIMVNYSGPVYTVKG